MLYILTFMACMGSECVWMQLEQSSIDNCSTMKNYVIIEARQEGKRVMALCTKKTEN